MEDTVNDGGKLRFDFGSPSKLIVGGTGGSGKFHFLFDQRVCVKRE